VAVRYAVRVNGLDALALTKLDVLDGLPELQVCTGYRFRGTLLTDSIVVASLLPAWVFRQWWRWC